uniref:Uncharacterized protein n=1 Tax=viral metagenome TaxID=1070528 RepID=A0A6M3M6N4_9ZZZZ
MNHTFEIPMSTFGPLREGQTAITFMQRTKRTGLPPPWLPDHLQDPFHAGDSIEFAAPIPPGVSVAGGFVQFDSRSCFFSAGDGPWESWEPPLFPLGYNPNIHPKPTAANRAFHFAKGCIKLNRTEQMLEFTINYTITDPALYEAWRTNGAALPAPESHEQLTLRLIDRAGLIPPLMLLAKETDQGRFVQQAVESGTWGGMLKLVELAQQEAR